jgi:hypothetical protein
VQPEVAPLDRAGRSAAADLDQTAGAAGVGAFAAVAETALVEMDDGGAHQSPIT